MLNRLVNGRVGFAWGVRATGFVVLGLLLAANLLMSSHPAVTSRKRPPKNIRALLTDAPYILLVIGFVSFDLDQDSLLRRLQRVVHVMGAFLPL